MPVDFVLLRLTCWLKLILISELKLIVLIHLLIHALGRLAHLPDLVAGVDFNRLLLVVVVPRLRSIVPSLALAAWINLMSL